MRTIIEWAIVIVMGMIIGAFLAGWPFYPL
jgi:hypothetical protein